MITDYRAAVLAEYPEAKLYMTRNNKYAIDLSDRDEDRLFVSGITRQEHAWSICYFEIKKLKEELK